MTKKTLDILVIEDTEKHQRAAREMLKEHNVTIASDATPLTTYDVGKYDVLLTGLFFPPGRESFMSIYHDGYDLSKPYGLGCAVPFIAARAGIKRVAVVSDANGCCGDDEPLHPLARAFELMGKEPFEIDGTTCMMFNGKDLPRAYLTEDGPPIYSICAGLKDIVFKANKYGGYSEICRSGPYNPTCGELPGYGRITARVKNWHAALKNLLEGVHFITDLRVPGIHPWYGI